MSSHKGVVEVSFDNSSIEFRERNSFESRNLAMIRLIDKAWSRLVRKDGPPGKRKSLSLYTDDVFSADCDYSFSVCSRDDAHRSMPNFIFDSWPECGIDSYESVFSQMTSLGDRPFDDERVFWIGNVSCPLAGYDNRRVGLAVANKHGDMFDFRSITWPDGKDRIPKTNGYVSLPDHCRHRVLVDFGGLGFSARIPLLLASGRPVILVGHPQEAWYYWDGTMVPWEHYIPCGELDGRGVDESKLYEAIRWTFDNRERSAEIGRNGREYAIANLTHDAAVDKIGRMLLAHSS